MASHARRGLMLWPVQPYDLTYFSETGVTDMICAVNIFFYSLLSSLLQYELPVAYAQHLLGENTRKGFCR